MKNYELMRSLHARGETTSTLAKKILSSRAQVSLTLNNCPGRGKLTRRKLAPLLTAKELGYVGWDAEGKVISSSTGNIVPTTNQTNEREEKHESVPQ